MHGRKGGHQLFRKQQVVFDRKRRRRHGDACPRRVGENDERHLLLIKTTGECVFAASAKIGSSNGCCLASDKKERLCTTARKDCGRRCRGGWLVLAVSHLHCRPRAYRRPLRVVLASNVPRRTTALTARRRCGQRQVFLLDLFQWLCTVRWCCANCSCP